MDAAPELDNPFWRFSLATYAAPGVAAECLTLQDALGLDVNLLLFCAWLGAERHVLLTRADIEQAAAVVQTWHERVVRPLRGVRQTLKTVSRKTPLRSKVKGVELEAEQVEQAMLYVFAADRWPRASEGDARQCVAGNVREFILHANNGDAPLCERYWPAQLVAAAIDVAR
jgi:uncharacterized protein (TIGR02444 family)